MKKLVVLLFISVMVFSCDKDEIPTFVDDQTFVKVREQPDCIKPYHIMHQKGNGDYVEICISCESYWGDPSDPEDFGHSIHEGDIVLSDEDGDGFVPFDCGFGMSGDCDDNDPTVYPGAVEVCDGVDNDCDGNIDDGLQNEYFEDNDGDGYGSEVVILACSPPEGYSEINGDCDDNDSAINPGISEICGDGIDNDCDGLTDCDDPDCDSECDEDCDPVTNLFCDYLHYFDFDEPCPDNDANGDAFCVWEIYYDWTLPLGWEVKLWDNDKALNDYCNGSDPDNDSGILQVIYGYFNQNWEYRITGNLALFDENGYYLGDAFPGFNIQVDEATAIAHAQFLTELAAANGLTDFCPGGPEF